MTTRSLATLIALFLWVVSVGPVFAEEPAAAEAQAEEPEAPADPAEAQAEEPEAPADPAADPKKDADEDEEKKKKEKKQKRKDKAKAKKAKAEESSAPTARTFAGDRGLATISAKKPDSKFARTFNGSQFTWNNRLSAASLNPGFQQTYDPRMVMEWRLIPVWNISESFSLNTNLALSKELTNSNISSKKYETFFGDVPVSLNYTRPLNKIQVNEMKFSVGLRGGLILPTSELSQYATKQLDLAVGGNFTATFTSVLKGLSLTWGPGFVKGFYESTTPRAEDHPLGLPAPGTEQSPTYLALQYGGGTNVNWNLTNSWSMNLQLTESLSFGFGYSLSVLHKYAPTELDESVPGEVCVNPMGCGEPNEYAGADQQNLFVNGFTYALNYRLPAPVNIFNVSLGASTVSNQLSSDGGYNVPFFNRYTVFNLGIGLSFSQLIDNIQGDRLR